MTTRLPATEKMIAKVMKRKELSEKDAIEYMLNVATGRLSALWRYDASVPEGKKSKGVITTIGRKKRADRSAPILTPSGEAEAKSRKAKPRKAKPRKAKPESKGKTRAQKTIDEAIAAADEAAQ